MLTKKQKEEFEIDNAGKEIKSIDDLVLVHVTDYIPEGGIIHSPKDAGVKFQKEFDGVQFELPSQRKTVHFSINGDITGTSHAGGSWTGKKYAIIIPLNLLNKDDFIGGIPSDFYSKRSIKIPKGAYMLCPEVERDSVQKIVGDDVSVIGVEEEYIDGYPPIIIHELGYKNETIGHWRFSSEKDSKIVSNIIQKFWKYEAHSFSDEMGDELISQDIIRTSIISKILRDKRKIPKESIKNILCQHNAMVREHNIFENAKYFEMLIQSLNEIAGINIPESVIKEIYNIKDGNFTEQHIEEAMEVDKSLMSIGKREGIGWFKKDESRYQRIAENILRRRILGEICINQIQTILNQRTDLTFEALLEYFDDISYNYTTEDRRNEFLDSMGLNLSEVDKKILCNKELKELYSEINEIKDIPYEQLAEEQKDKVSQFKKFYESQNKNRFNGYRLHSVPMRDKSKNMSMHLAIMRRDLRDISQEEIQKIQSECVGIDEELAFLDFETEMKGETTLAQYLTAYENYITELDELMNEKNKDDVDKDNEVSAESLGEQTLEEQKDTEAKLNMQQKIKQKMKEYIISQEKGEEK